MQKKKKKKLNYFRRFFINRR